MKGKQCNAMQCNAMQCNAMQCNATQSNAMQCYAIQCNAMLRNPRQRNATQCNAMQGNARQRNARQGKARQGKARQGKARQGKARQCNAMQCKAMQCNATQSNPIQDNHCRTKQNIKTQNYGKNHPTILPLTLSLATIRCYTASLWLVGGWEAVSENLKIPGRQLSSSLRTNHLSCLRLNTSSKQASIQAKNQAVKQRAYQTTNKPV